MLTNVGPTLIHVIRNRRVRILKEAIVVVAIKVLTEMEEVVTVGFSYLCFVLFCPKDAYADKQISQNRDNAICFLLI